MDNRFNSCYREKNYKNKVKQCMKLKQVLLMKKINKFFRAWLQIKIIIMMIIIRNNKRIKSLIRIIVKKFKNDVKREL